MAHNGCKHNGFATHNAAGRERSAVLGQPAFSSSSDQGSDRVRSAVASSPET